MVESIFKDDVNLMAGCGSWIENYTLFPTIWLDFLYNAGIWNVMTRSRWDIGYSRLCLAEDLWLSPFSKMMSTSWPVVGLGWRTGLGRLWVLDGELHSFSHYMARFPI
jgi:hypothetical protein